MSVERRKCPPGCVKGAAFVKFIFQQWFGLAGDGVWLSMVARQLPFGRPKSNACRTPFTGSCL